jgi:hypothetical protein
MAENYIKRLERENAEKTAEIARLEQELRDFDKHCNSAKFKGVEADGSRRDWIATGDVHSRIERILQPL